jgi:hypothetical protein
MQRGDARAKRGVLEMNDASLRPQAHSPELPSLVRTYLDRALPTVVAGVKAVRVHQAGEMWKKPEARPVKFEATEDFEVHRVAFRWRARFPIVGPLAMNVVDGFGDGEGQLRVSFLGIPLQKRTGFETSIGQAMRYLAELPWAPYAIAANRELSWRELDDSRVEVSCRAAQRTARVAWEFDSEGDLVRATGLRPFPQRKSYVPTSWGGEFQDYRTFGDVRIPAAAEAWWELREGRFVYWRGRVDAAELVS